MAHGDSPIYLDDGADAIKRLVAERHALHRHILVLVVYPGA